MRAASRERDTAQGVGVFRAGGARPPLAVMCAFADTHKQACGVEPTCRVLQIAPSGYYTHRARCADPTRRSTRARRGHDATNICETTCIACGRRIGASTARGKSGTSSGAKDPRSLAALSSG